jgi:enoyl-CoA hydratase/carnithine racemase
MSDYEHLLDEQCGPVTIITINRPERMNAIGPQTHRELVDAWDRFRTDDNALVGSIFASETAEGLRRFNERDHPDRRAGSMPITPGLA